MANHVPAVLTKQKPIGSQFCFNRFVFVMTSICDFYNVSLGNRGHQLLVDASLVNKSAELNGADLDSRRFATKTLLQRSRKRFLELHGRVVGGIIKRQFLISPEFSR